MLGDMAETIGADGHPIPEKQGIVEAQFEPIRARDVIKNLGKGTAAAKGVALYLPQFEMPPALVPGTEALDGEGRAVAGTGQAVPESIRCKPITLEKAADAARKLLAVASKMEINELSVDLLNMAFAVLHYDNGHAAESATDRAARHDAENAARDNAQKGS